MREKRGLNEKSRQFKGPVCECLGVNACACAYVCERASVRVRVRVGVRMCVCACVCVWVKELCERDKKILNLQAENLVIKV